MVPNPAFQYYMDHIFNGLEFIFIYMDDILVASRNRQEHLLHLREVFRRLKQAGLILKLAKCTLVNLQWNSWVIKSAAAASALWPPRCKLYTATPGRQQSRSFSSFLAC